VTSIFIHGSGGDADVWRRQTEHFEGSVALTLPGHSGGELCDSIESAAAWTWSELQTRSVDKPILVGHSLGGAIALQLALEHPDEIAGLVLVGSGARLRVHPMILEALEGFVAGKDGFEAMFGSAYDRVEASFAEDLKQGALGRGPEPFLVDLRACDRFDVIERLGEIRTPTLAVVGTDDAMTPPKYSHFLADRMPNARVEVVEGGTHFVFAELPERVNAAISEFIGEL